MYVLSKYNVYIDYSDDKTFVFNTATGSGALLDNKLVGQDCSFDDASEVEKTMLLKHGFFCPVDSEKGYDVFREAARVKYYADDFKSQLFIITPTMSCNADCRYCFEKDQHKFSEMSEDMQSKTLAFMRHRIESHPKTKKVTVSFFGGEPTLKLSIVEHLSSEIRRICQDKGIEYDARIITNGILLNNENTKRLVDAGVIRCQVTLDGLEDAWTKSKNLPASLFYRILSNLRVAVDNGMKPIVRINIDKNNKCDIIKLLDILFGGLDLAGKIQVTPCLLKVWNDTDDTEHYMSSEEYLDFLDECREYVLSKGWERSFDNYPLGPKPSSCGMMRQSAIGIRYDGKLYQCEHMFSEEMVDGVLVPIGDVTNGLYENSPMRDVFGQETEPMEGHDCKTCKWYPVCHGGCRMEYIMHHRLFDCESFEAESIARLKYMLRTMGR